MQFLIFHSTSTNDGLAVIWRKIYVLRNLSFAHIFYESEFSRVFWPVRKSFKSLDSFFVCGVTNVNNLAYGLYGLSFFMPTYISINILFTKKKSVYVILYWHNMEIMVSWAFNINIPLVVAQCSCRFFPPHFQMIVSAFVTLALKFNAEIVASKWRLLTSLGTRGGCWGGFVWWSPMVIKVLKKTKNKNIINKIETSETETDDDLKLVQ